MATQPAFRKNILCKTAAENANAAQASLTCCFCVIWRIAHYNNFVFVYAGQKLNGGPENVRIWFRRFGIVRSRFLVDDVLDAADLFVNFSSLSWRMRQARCRRAC